MFLWNFTWFCGTFWLIPTFHDCSQYQQANHDSNNYALAKHNDFKSLSTYNVVVCPNKRAYVRVNCRSRIFVLLDSLGDTGVPMQYPGKPLLPVCFIGVPSFYQMRVMHMQMYTHNQWQKNQKENSLEGITWSEMGKQKKCTI